MLVNVFVRHPAENAMRGLRTARTGLDNRDGLCAG